VLVQAEALLLTYAGFALAQAVARGQPLAIRLGAGAACARALLRLAALGLLGLACGVLARERGWADGGLFALAGLVLVASAFVPLAPVAPRMVWGLALAATPLAAAAGLAARWAT
jgi:hypothetical protein